MLARVRPRKPIASFDVNGRAYASSGARDARADPAMAYQVANNSPRIEEAPCR